MFENDLTYSCFRHRTFTFSKSFVFENGGDVPSPGGAEKQPDTPKAAPEKPVDEKEAAGMAADKTKKKGNVMIEAGARIPIPISGEAEPGKVEDVDAIGGEIVARYVLTDPTKPYIALTFPLSVDYRSISIVTTGATVSGELADEVTFTGGVGVEGGVPLGSVLTLYGGVGVEAGARVYDYVSASTDGAAGMGTDVTATFAASGTAGVRVNPTTNWHLYAGVKPTVTFTGGPGIKVPVQVGTGFSF